MKTRALYLAVVVILVSLGVAVALYFYFKEEVEPRTIYVPDDYGTIQWAVHKAAPGSTIIVRDGTYRANVDVDKRLTVKSENSSANCIVVALHADDSVFRVTADYTSINGFTMTGTADSWKGEGISLRGVEHCNISGNNATGNYIGIGLSDSDNNTLRNNIASSNDKYGILLGVQANNNMLVSNIASNNTDTGIYVLEGRNTLVNNTADGNHLVGIELISSNNMLTNNTASRNAVGVLLANWNNILVSNIVNGNSIGIDVRRSENNVIYNNYFNNTKNIRWRGMSVNAWNITRTAGTNIIGGPYLGGNYWSDYAGVDTDGDGLGNTLLPHNGDYLPLVPLNLTSETTGEGG